MHVTRKNRKKEKRQEKSRLLNWDNGLDNWKEDRDKLKELDPQDWA